MKVKEGIVYDKHRCEVLGYINLGEVINQLLEFEHECASDKPYIPPTVKYISYFMARGIFLSVMYPYATTGASANQLFPIMWEAIKAFRANRFKSNLLQLMVPLPTESYIISMPIRREKWSTKYPI